MDDMDILVAFEEQQLQQMKIALKQVYMTWTEIGLGLDQKIERQETAWSHIQKLVKDIGDEENAMFVEITKTVKSYTEQISDLSKALSVVTNELAGLTLIERERALRHEIDCLVDLKEQRLREYEELKDDEQYYCEFLGIDDLKLSPTTEVPSKAFLEELRNHISMLTCEKEKRLECFNQAREQLATIFETTELSPESEQEKVLIAGREPLLLSEQAMKIIEETLNNAKQRKAQLEDDKKHLIEKLKVLWGRLKIGSPVKVEFLSKHVDCKYSTIKSIQQELGRCQEIRKQNMGLIIESVRTELEDLWSKCKASESQKMLFHQYFSTEISENVLVSCESEVERWKIYYEDVKFILEKIEKRNKLWQLLVAMDHKASDPSRFKNRGGNLLREERERNKVQKTLPALEAEIYQEIEAYETQKGKKFLYQGKDYRSQISKQWVERSSHKENIKQEKNRLLVTPVKRPPIGTPKSAPPRMRNVKLPTYCTPTPKPKMIPHTVKKQPRPKTIKKRDQDILKEINKQVANTPAEDTAYADFAYELDRTARQGCRSSVVASKKIAGTRISKSKRKSVIKSPETHYHIDLTSVRGKSGLPFLM